MEGVEARSSRKRASRGGAGGEEDAVSGGGGGFHCTYCGAKFKTLQALGGHKSIHSGIKRKTRSFAPEAALGIALNLPIHLDPGQSRPSNTASNDSNLSRMSTWSNLYARQQLRDPAPAPSRQVSSLGLNSRGAQPPRDPPPLARLPLPWTRQPQTQACTSNNNLKAPLAALHASADSLPSLQLSQQHTGQPALAQSAWKETSLASLEKPAAQVPGCFPWPAFVVQGMLKEQEAPPASSLGKSRSDVRDSPFAKVWSQGDNDIFATEPGVGPQRSSLNWPASHLDSVSPVDSASHLGSASQLDSSSLELGTKCQRTVLPAHALFPRPRHSSLLHQALNPGVPALYPPQFPCTSVQMTPGHDTSQHSDISCTAKGKSLVYDNDRPLLQLLPLAINSSCDDGAEIEKAFLCSPIGCLKLALRCSPVACPGLSFREANDVSSAESCIPGGHDTGVDGVRPRVESLSQVHALDLTLRLAVV